MGFFIRGLVFIAVVLVLQHVVKLGLLMGFLKQVYYHSPGPCHVVKNINYGSEDIQTLSNGIAILSSGLVYGVEQRKDGVKPVGSLYMFDFNNPEAGATRISEGIKLENPHGLSLWEQPNSDKVTVFVVNHAKGGDVIEKLEFDKSSNTLKHIKTIADPLFYSLNDVVASGTDTFYATNEYGSSGHVTRRLEMWLMMHFGNVVYYDGRRAQVTISRLQTPNGLNRSPDGRFLFVSSPVERSISIFTRKSETQFKLKKRYHLDAIVDNIDVTSDDHLWVGAHALGHKVVEYLEDPRKESPSQVLRLTLDDGNITHVEEVYSGVLISGSTVANYYKGAMLVGTVQTELMYCKVLHLD